MNPPPTEASISLADLGSYDAFAPNWPTVIPAVLKALGVTMQAWSPAVRSKLLSNPVQRFVLALSDEEAIVATKKFVAGGNPMQEVEDQGYVIKGSNKRRADLMPRWSGWLNETRNCPLQVLGMASMHRALYSPELQQFYPSIVHIFSDQNLKSMEHRHMVQLLKQVREARGYIDVLSLVCEC